ncbi:MAG TPA: DUF1003 domain-containing protein [Actinomycetota bacterium]
MSADELRYHRAHAGLHGTFGSDTFGVLAERLARFFGTPRYILAQSFVVVLWLAYNGWVAIHYLSTKAFDPYPFILLNLAFSTQAAYAAPLILLAQTRQAARDKASEVADAKHREDLSERALVQGKQIETLLVQNTELTQAVHDLTEKIHELVARGKA